MSACPELKISNGDKVKIPETVTIDNKTYRYSGAHLDKVSGENVYSVKVNKSGEWKYKEKPDGSNEKWNKGKGGINLFSLPGTDTGTTNCIAYSWYHR